MATLNRSITRSRCAACSLLLLLAALPCIVAWQVWRQATLNQALIAAIRMSDANRVVTLLDAGADPNSREANVPIMTAWLQWLLDYWNDKPRSSITFSTAVALALDRRRDHNGFLPQTTKIVRALVRKGADVNLIAPSGDTPLLMLFQPRDLSKYNARLNDFTSTELPPIEDTELLRLLLDAGAKVDVRDYMYRKTPLVIATEYGFKNSVRLLLKSGANPNAPAGTYDDETPLWFARMLGHQDIVRMLVAHGAKK